MRQDYRIEAAIVRAGQPFAYPGPRIAIARSSWSGPPEWFELSRYEPPAARRATGAIRDIALERLAAAQGAGETALAPIRALAAAHGYEAIGLDVYCVPERREATATIRRASDGALLALTASPTTGALGTPLLDALARATVAALAAVEASILPGGPL